VKALTDINGPLSRKDDSVSMRPMKKGNPEAALLYFEKWFD
jgi:hypothetical protein